MASRAPRRLGAALTAVAAAAVALAAGCAGQAKRTDADLLQLSDWLPGFYDNQVQIAADRQAGRAPHESLLLTVVPVDTEQLGTGHVFYMQEMTAGASQRVTMQRLLSFSAVKDGIVETVWTLNDPERWRGAVTTPELFTALQPDDIRPMRGCNLKWKKEGERFTAQNDPSTCRALSPRTGGVEFMDMRVELSADELAISTRPVERGASGQGGDPYDRFRRNGGS